MLTMLLVARTFQRRLSAAMPALALGGFLSIAALTGLATIFFVIGEMWVPATATFFVSVCAAALTLVAARIR